jgi:hypothetical protein
MIRLFLNVEREKLLRERYDKTKLILEKLSKIEEKLLEIDEIKSRVESLENESKILKAKS